MISQFTFLRKSYFLLFLAVISIQFSYGQSADVKFSTNPAAISDTVKVCQGQSVIFVNQSTNTTEQSTYNWTFGTGSNPSSSTSLSPISVNYQTVTNGTTASLSINNNNGSIVTSKSITIVVLAAPNSNLILRSTGKGFSTALNNGTKLFKNCNAIDTALFVFESNYDNTIQQVFNWGDGSQSTQDSLSGKLLSHAYPLGEFNLTHTILFSNGCSFSKSYTVFNGSAPIVTVSGAGQSTCLPAPYSFDLISNDVPINFTVSFSDGSNAMQFKTSRDTTISHNFTNSSCGVDYVYAPGMPPIENAFSGTIIAQNFCSNNGIPTVLTIGPITISTPTKANFDINPISPICQHEIVKLKNKSKAGESINASGCDSTYYYFWKIDPPKGFVVLTGNTGSGDQTNDPITWINGSDELQIQFDSTTFYNITLVTGNACGIDTLLKTIEIKPNATVLANPVTQKICSGDTSTVIELTSTIPGYHINWEITASNGIRGIQQFSGIGLSPVKIDSMILYNDSNTLKSITYTAHVGCSNVPKTNFKIDVEPIPTLTATPIFSTICNGNTTDIKLKSNINGSQFSWIALADAAIIGESNGTGNSIQQQLFNTSSDFDTVSYQVKISNAFCPSSPVNVKVKVQPELTINANPDFNVCPGDSINPIPFVSSPIGAQFNWTNTNNQIGLSNAGQGSIPLWLAPKHNSRTAVTGKITVTAQLNNCPAVFDTFNVAIQPKPLFSSVLNPSTGLNCKTNSCSINGQIDPSYCKLTWTGPQIVNGIHALNPEIKGAGIYQLIAIDSLFGCADTFRIVVDAPTPLQINTVQTTDVLCYGGNDGSIQVSTLPANQQLTYTWKPNVSNSANARNLKVGTYQLWVSNEDQCTDSIVASINQPAPMKINLVDSLNGECGEASGYIEISADGGKAPYAFRWQNGSNNAKITDIDAGTYWVRVTDQNNCAYDTSFAIGCRPLIPIRVPQLITQNNDGKNDGWIIENLELYPNNSVQIFNRWGNLVYEANPYQNNWKGESNVSNTGNGQLPDGTYFYLIDTNKKSQLPYKGFIEIQH